jgi:hypothetical protein
MGKLNEEICSRVIELTDLLLTIGGITDKDLWQLHGDNPAHGHLKEARELAERIINELVDANPKMVSRRLVLDRIIYQIIGVILQRPGWRDEMLEKLEPTVEEILRYEAWRDVDVPLINIHVDGDPFAYGPGTFYSLGETDKDDSWWMMIEGYVGTSSAAHQVVSFLRINAPGDTEKATDFAGGIADELLLILRGLCFPITAENLIQIGVVSDFPSMHGRPFRVQNPRQSARIDYPSPQVTRLGPPIRPYDLYRELLSNIDTGYLETARHFLASQFENPSTQIRHKYLEGLRWLGEASKPDAASARYAKVAFALEALIGGEPNEEMLTQRGITATLAERGAFLAGDDPESRRNVDRAIRGYYGKRSDIVHGRGAQIGSADLTGFANLARAIAQSLLSNESAFEDIDALQRWVIDRRYA